MIRYIDSKEVLDAIQGHMWKRQEDKDLATEIVENTPTEDPVRHGHWIKHEKTEKEEFYEECSLCHCVYNEGGYMAYGYYCPHCGARMDEVSK